MSALRVPRQSPNALRVKWADVGEDGPDLYASWGEGVHSASGRYVLNAISEMKEELQQRGFDIRTLRFEILKTQSTHPQPQHPTP